MARPLRSGCSLMRPLGNQGPRRMFAALLERGGNKTRLTGPLWFFPFCYTVRVLRIWLCVIALLCASVSGSGFVPVPSSGEACSQNCPDDDSRGQCSPDCADCTCCAHPRPVALIRTSWIRVSPLGTLLPFEEEQEPLSVYTGDILHVPRISLA